MNLLFAILIQAPLVPTPQPAPVSSIIVERFGISGKEVKMEYNTPSYKNIYF